MRAAFSKAATLVAAAALSACAQTYTPKVDVVQPSSARPVVVAPPLVANGSIYQNAAYRPLFEDYRARQVGDTVTVTITEKVSATQKSTSSINKSGTVDTSVGAFPFLKDNTLSKLTANASTKNDFSGKGSTENTNDFSGNITATVIEVLSNGHLIISGEKQIGVNQNVDVLRFSGQIDPRAIQPGNTVASTQIANVRLEHRGRGAQADAQEIGWVGRFFLSVLPL